MVIDRIYYEDQAAWQPSDYYALWRYFDRLAEYVGPTNAQRANPTHRSARIQAKKMHVRDDEFAAIDTTHMSPETLCLLRAVLTSRGRYELALERFPNLRTLERTSPPAQFAGFEQYPASVQGLLATES